MTVSTAARDVALLVSQMNKRGKNIPESVKLIRPFPVKEFADLRRLRLLGRLHLTRFSFTYDPDIFNLVALPIEQTRQNIALAMMYGLPVIGLLSGLFVSWWLLLLAPLGIVGMRWMRAVYNTAIVRAASESEGVFCFLYYIGQVSVFDSSSDKHYFWDSTPAAHSSLARAS